MSILGNIGNWISDQLASSDVIDLYFVVTDLVDVPISEAEACETAHYDAECTEQARRRPKTKGYQPRNKNLRQY